MVNFPMPGTSCHVVFEEDKLGVALSLQNSSLEARKTSESRALGLFFVVVVVVDYFYFNYVKSAKHF